MIRCWPMLALCPVQQHHPACLCQGHSEESTNRCASQQCAENSTTSAMFTRIVLSAKPGGSAPTIGDLVWAYTTECSQQLRWRSMANHYPHIRMRPAFRSGQKPLFVPGDVLQCPECHAMYDCVAYIYEGDEPVVCTLVGCPGHQSAHLHQTGESGT